MPKNNFGSVPEDLRLREANPHEYVLRAILDFLDGAGFASQLHGQPTSPRASGQAGWTGSRAAGCPFFLDDRGSARYGDAHPE
ncbi:MAG TPA: hypothetical protein VNS22_15855 [Geminicoccus sp.]|uniref:hypothetical protein n=1 Tax=Geminicoccus sp. TaxID=2024832 RepID=UPI002BE98BC8|nr:hypothetical protein [Geminicoccus sp.]HWL69845.1 hypothetical protein [Geminicoccus sp.]